MTTACIAGLVVTYRPGAEVAAHLRILREQVEELVVVDNESSPASTLLLAEWARDPHVTVIANPRNVGLARALNQGIETALARGCDWVATFDQDSRVPTGYVRGLFAALATAPATESIGVLAPVYRDLHLGFVFSPAARLPANAEPRAVAVANTSGCLVRAATLRSVGAMCESFFIDCVDFEFCLRARRGGWVVWEVPSVVLDHAQGRWTQRRLLGWRTQLNDYPAQRRYYQLRNRLVMWRRHAAFDPRWCVADAWGFAREFVKLLLFGEERLVKLRAMLQGAWHALIGFGGARPSR